MDIRDTLSAELPPPRDDEPARLRQDILDELADHLGCADRRELLCGANPVEARQRVLNRFGDPAAVARRLWLDAMKGKIMAQRILMATCLMVTLASLSLTGLMWRESVLAQRQSAAMAVESLHAMTLQNEKAQASQQELLKQLRAISEANQKPRSPDWNPVRFQIAEETSNGPPVAGCSISLSERDRISDTSGKAEMGILHPGSYRFDISKTWSEGRLDGWGILKVEPGSEVNQLIVVPRTMLERVAVRIRYTWPDDLEKEDLVLEAPFLHNGIVQSGVTWSVWHRWTSEKQEEAVLDEGQRAYRGTLPVLVGPWPPLLDRPGLSEIFNSREGFYLWVPGGTNDFRASVLAKHVHPIQGPEPTLMWERGAYDLASLMVLRPLASSDRNKGIKHFGVLVETRRREGTVGMVYEVRDGTPTEYTLTRSQQNVLATASTAALELPDEYWSRLNDSFQARPGQINQWTIPLPDELIKAVREKLDTEKKSRTANVGPPSPPTR